MRSGADARLTGGAPGGMLEVHSICPQWGPDQCMPPAGTCSSAYDARGEAGEDAARGDRTSKSKGPMGTLPCTSDVTVGQAADLVNVSPRNVKTARQAVTGPGTCRRLQRVAPATAGPTGTITQFF